MLKALVLAPFYGGAAVAFSLMGYVVAPDVEARFFPILADQKVGPTWRTSVGLPGPRACFKWTYTKERDPPLIRQDFTVERPNGIHDPVDELRPEIGIASNATTTARKGERRTISECVLLRAPEQKLDRFVIRGNKIYRPWHGLYEIRQPLLPVIIDVDTPSAPPSPEDDPSISG